MVETRKAFVAGFPVKHSYSPLIHGFWLKTYGLSGSYEPLEIIPEAFQGFILTLAENHFVGGNLTIPYKEKAFSLCTKCDATAHAVGAVNTLWFENNQLVGGNTDAYGFATNLDEYAPDWDHSDVALVLGAGGASRAVVYTLIERGFKHIHVVNRTVTRAEELVQYFGPVVLAQDWSQAQKLVAHTGIIINTTPLGMTGYNNENVILDLSMADRKTIVSDIVYAPLETPILKHARENRLQVVDGLGMLLHQAVPGFEHWFGIRPKVTDELRTYILANMPTSSHSEQQKE